MAEKGLNGQEHTALCREAVVEPTGQPVYRVQAAILVVAWRVACRAEAGLGVR